MFLHAWMDDLREAARRLRRQPRFSLLAIATLALGIGSATAVFTMAHTALLAPPPYREPDRIFEVEGARKGYRYVGVSQADFLDLQAEPGLFEVGALTSYEEFSWTGQSAPGFGGAEVLRGLSVTPDYFRVLDQPMAAGRGFSPGEHGAVVISYGYWQRRFGGWPQIIGQSLTLNGEPCVVVGVAGARFLPFESYEVTIWRSFQPRNQWRDSRQYSALVRLAAGIDAAQAEIRLNALTARLAAAYPGTNANYSATLRPLLAETRKKAAPAFTAMAAAVLCLLLIAAANAASLLLARAAARAREMAMRSALGAGRGRLYRLVIFESLLLSLTAGVAGVLIAVWMIDAARALAPASFQVEWMFRVDWRVAAMACLLSMLAGVAAGLAPAMESFRLASGGLRSGPRRVTLLRAIVVAEVAASCVLAVGAGLLGKSFAALLARPLGYQTEERLGMRIRLAGEPYRGVARRAAYWAELLERVRAVPGIAAASTVSDLPMGWQYSGTRFEVEGQPTVRREEAPRCHLVMAAPGYLSTMGIPLLRGRDFTTADGPDSEPVVLINDLLAETYFPRIDPLNRRVRDLNGAWRRIVGVVRRIRHTGPTGEHENEIYVPYRQRNSSTMFLVVRTNVPPGTVTPAIRATLAGLDPNVPAFEIRTLDQAFGRETAMARLPMILTGVFGFLAAVLAGLGLFGVVSGWVAQRRRELGIRAALGAERGRLQRLVVGQGVQLAMTGLVIGLAGSLATMRLLRSLLYGMSEKDAQVYLAVAALVVVTTLAACWIPARNAARADPSACLREE